MTLQELLEWHRHQAQECRHEGEEGEKAFHLEAFELLKHLEGHSRLCCRYLATPNPEHSRLCCEKISQEEEETAWHCQVLTKSLEGWTAEEIENLTSSLDVAVQTTCDQISGEVDKDFSF